MTTGLLGTVGMVGIVGMLLLFFAMISFKGRDALGSLTAPVTPAVASFFLAISPGRRVAKGSSPPPLAFFVGSSFFTPPAAPALPNGLTGCWEEGGGSVGGGLLVWMS